MSIEAGSIQAVHQPEMSLSEPRWEAIRDVNKHRAVHAAGARAILMQVSHPFVAQAIVDAGYFAHNPLQRLIETSQAGVNLIFGEPEKAEAVARMVRAMHIKVDSGPEEDRKLKQNLGPHYKKGDIYSAHDQDAQKWVAATIVDSSFRGYEAFVGPLSEERKAQYIEDAQELFATMGLQAKLPQTDAELKAYIQEMIDDKHVIVGRAARRLSPKIILKGVFPGSEVLASYLKLSTLALLPDELRRQFRLQKLTKGQRKVFELSAAGFRTLLPHLPSVITQNPQAIEAERRRERLPAEERAIRRLTPEEKAEAKILGDVLLDSGAFEVLAAERQNSWNDRARLIRARELLLENESEGNRLETAYEVVENQTRSIIALGSRRTPGAEGEFEIYLKRDGNSLFTGPVGKGRLKLELSRGFGIIRKVMRSERHHRN